MGLHAITRSAGLTLDTVGGTVEQAKADLSAGGEFVNAIVPKAFLGRIEVAHVVLACGGKAADCFFP